MFDPQTLTSVAAGRRLDNLAGADLANVQRALAWLTYPISAVDGKYGPNTRAAIRRLDIGFGNIQCRPFVVGRQGAAGNQQEQEGRRQMPAHAIAPPALTVIRRPAPASSG